MKGLLLISFIYLVLISSSPASDTIKIMPVGNSITAGEHYKFPGLEERTGYRKALFEMLTNAGYHIDFVGSQKHGIRPEDDKDWYDWNCEAYPGWKIPDISSKVDTALNVYQPDILLVHVGTNGSGWDEKPAQVKEILDMINRYSIRNNLHKLPDPGANPPYEGGDMLGNRYPGVAHDRYHPNDKGNTKMAAKFYEELVKVLPVPAKTENK